MYTREHRIPEVAITGDIIENIDQIIILSILYVNYCIKKKVPEKKLLCRVLVVVDQCDFH